MTQHNRTRLREAIHRLVGSRHSPFTTGAIAHEIMNGEAYRELWHSVRDELAAEKLAGIINGTLRGPLHQANSAQLDLPGFEDLPKVIRANRKWVALRDANADELTEFTKWYRARFERNEARTKRDRQILKDVETLARLVIRYDKTRPGITVSEVLALREVRAQYPSRVN